MDKDFENVFLVFHVVKSGILIANKLANVHLHQVNQETKHLFFVGMGLADGTLYLRDDAGKLRGLRFTQCLIKTGIEQVQGESIAQIVVVFHHIVIKCGLNEKETAFERIAATDEIGVLHRRGAQNTVLFQAHVLAVDAHFGLSINEQKHGIKVNNMQLFHQQGECSFVDNCRRHDRTKGRCDAIMPDKVGQVMLFFAFHRLRKNLTSRKLIGTQTQNMGTGASFSLNPKAIKRCNMTI